MASLGDIIHVFDMSAGPVVTVQLLLGRGIVSHPYHHHLQGREAPLSRRQQQTPQHVPVPGEDVSVSAHGPDASVCEEHQETQRNYKPVSALRGRGRGLRREREGAEEGDRGRGKGLRRGIDGANEVGDGGTGGMGGGLGQL